MKLYSRVAGDWVDIVVEDNFPVHETGALVACSPPDFEKDGEKGKHAAC